MFQRKQPRRGATMVETAIVLSTCLVLVGGAFDVGLAALRFNLVGEGARRAARVAIVSGASAVGTDASWGPATYEGTAGDDNPLADALRSVLATMDAGEVQLRVEWPDGDNQTDDRVRVEVVCEHQPLVTWFTGGQSLQLRAVSTMKIEY